MAGRVWEEYAAAEVRTALGHVSQQATQLVNTSQLASGICSARVRQLEAEVLAKEGRVVEYDTWFHRLFPSKDLLAAETDYHRLQGELSQLRTVQNDLNAKNQEVQQLTSRLQALTQVTALPAKVGLVAQCLVCNRNMVQSGTPTTNAADVESLRREIADLKQQIITTATAGCNITADEWKLIETTRSGKKKDRLKQFEALVDDTAKSPAWYQTVIDAVKLGSLSGRACKSRDEYYGEVFEKSFALASDDFLMRTPASKQPSVPDDLLLAISADQQFAQLWAEYVQIRNTDKLNRDREVLIEAAAQKSLLIMKHLVAIGSKWEQLDYDSKFSPEKCFQTEAEVKKYEEDLPLSLAREFTDNELSIMFPGTQQMRPFVILLSTLALPRRLDMQHFRKKCMSLRDLLILLKAHALYPKLQTLNTDTDRLLYITTLCQVVHANDDMRALADKIARDQVVIPWYTYTNDTVIYETSQNRKQMRDDIEKALLDAANPTTQAAAKIYLRSAWLILPHDQLQVDGVLFQPVHQSGDKAITTIVSLPLRQAEARARISLSAEYGDLFSEQEKDALFTKAKLDRSQIITAIASGTPAVTVLPPAQQKMKEMNFPDGAIRKSLLQSQLDPALYGY